jgi:ribonuclease HII
MFRALEGDSRHMLKPRHTDDSKVEVGIDEAGRGCLWGPLVAAAVQWPEEGSWTEELRNISAQIKDSKKLSAKRRGLLEEAIKKHAVCWAIGRVEAAEIDSLGMTKANRLAFRRAVIGLGVTPGRILIDGILGLNYSRDVEEIVEAKGDGTYLAIAAASIIAKEGRDRMVKDMCEADATIDQRYGLLSSKGYGTLKHRTAIKEHGMHVQHRKLFLRKLLGLDHTVHTEYEFIDD